MKQSDDPKAFFEKFGFTCSMSKKHPEFKEETMHFEGLECEYVQRLERELAETHKYIRLQHDKIEFMTDREWRIYERNVKRSEEGNRNGQ